MAIGFFLSPRYHWTSQSTSDTYWYEVTQTTVFSSITVNQFVNALTFQFT